MIKSNHEHPEVETIELDEDYIVGSWQGKDHL